jgi:hypothetical protein
MICRCDFLDLCEKFAESTISQKLVIFSFQQIKIILNEIC